MPAERTARQLNRRSPFDRSSYGVCQLASRQRLRQVVDDANAQRVHQILEAPGVGDHHNTEVLNFVTQPPGELQPV